jgi:hypothetical protein
MAKHLTAFAALLAACQVSQFEPVEPITLTHVRLRAPVGTLKPNVMLAVDRSGSMNAPVSSDPSCSTCAPPNCPTLCAATRLSELKSAVNVLSQLVDDKVRLGLAVFPTPLAGTSVLEQCAAPTSATVPLPAPSAADDQAASAANRVSVQRVNMAVQTLSAGGGTPTGATMQWLATLPSLTDVTDARDDYVVLLTDGLPNCNEANPNDFERDPTTCRCQVSGNVCSGPDLRTRGCLDVDATEQQVDALARLRIKTVVIGFGADVSQGDARTVLERLARAGQAGSAYFASDRMELERVLATVLDGIGRPCTYVLPSTPVVPSAVSVTLDGQSIPQSPQTWGIIGNNVVLNRVFCDNNASRALEIAVASGP